MDAPDSATEIYVTDPSFANLKRLTNTNPQLTDVAQGETEVITWKSSDGVEVEGVLLKPVGFKLGKRYPTLVVAHGGPAGAFVNGFRLGGVLPQPARQLELRTADAGRQRQRRGGGIPNKQTLPLYLDRPAMTHIDKATTPTLILHGANDERVPVGQAYELYRGLKDRGKPTELVLYPREGHGIGEY